MPLREEDIKPITATPEWQLARELADPRVGKTEREHYAARRIADLEAENASFRAGPLEGRDRLTLERDFVRQVNAIGEKLAEAEERIAEDNAVCICGCADHESLGEDGEQCDHEDHECVRVAPAVRDMFAAMRRERDDAVAGEARYALELDLCVEAFAHQHAAMARNGRRNVAAIAKDIISERDELQEKYTRCYSELVNTARRASLAERDLIDAQRERDEARAAVQTWSDDYQRLAAEVERLKVALALMIKMAEHLPTFQGTPMHEVLSHWFDSALPQAREALGQK